MKKSILSFFVLIIMLILSACGSKTQPEPTVVPTEAPKEVPTEAPTEIPVESSAEEPVETAAEETAVSEESAAGLDSIDPNDSSAVYEYYSAHGDLIAQSYAFSQLNTSGKKVWTAPFAGIDEFQVPDAFLNAKGGLRASGGMEEDQGFVSMSVVYIAGTEADYDKFVADMGVVTDEINEKGMTEENRQKYEKLVEAYNEDVTTLFTVLGIPNGAGEAEDKAAYEKYVNDHAEWYEYTEDEIKAYLDKLVFYPAGSAEGYNFYLVQGNLPDDNNIEKEDSAYQEEYQTLYNNIADYVSAFKFMKPLGLTQMIESGTGISFETTDVFGSSVKSSDLFSGHKVTMLNIWETTCGACISEMPQLIVLNEELQSKGAQIVGLVYDATDADLIAEAKDIVEDMNIPYTNIVPNDELLKIFNVQSFPTTYFINEKGELVGTPVLGATFKLYRDQIETLLAE